MTGAGPIGLFVKTRPELDSPDVQYQFLAGSAPKTGDPMHEFPACTLVAIPCRPESRGWLRITVARSDACRRRCSRTTSPRSATRTPSSPA